MFPVWGKRCNAPHTFKPRRFGTKGNMTPRCEQPRKTDCLKNGKRTKQSSSLNHLCRSGVALTRSHLSKYNSSIFFPAKRTNYRQFFVACISRFLGYGAVIATTLFVLSTCSLQPQKNTENYDKIALIASKQFQAKLPELLKNPEVVQILRGGL